MPRRHARLARVLAVLLALGLVALHVPLDAFRAASAAEADGCCACAPPAPPVHAGACSAAQDAAPWPSPRDGCEDGCHCGCCGGLPLLVDPAVAASLDAPSVRSPGALLQGARSLSPLEVFHPPRV